MDVMVVLPTRIAFAENAAEAMLNGTYGERTDVTDEYLSQLLAFVEDVVHEANKNGVETDGFRDRK
jgi:hypothetical protein